MITSMIDMLPYLLLGVGVGYLVTLGVTGGPTSLDRKKEDLEAKKEWIKMQRSKNVRR